MTENQFPTDTLNAALEQLLAPPQLPADFRDTLMSKVKQESRQHVNERRLALEREHALAREQLDHGHVRMQRDTLALVVGVAFTAGACAHVALPWLQSVVGADSIPALLLLAGGLGAAAGVSVLPGRPT